MSDINVGSVAGAYSSYSYEGVKADSAAKDTAADVKAEEAGVVYEKSTGVEKKATYSINKMSAEDRAALVQQLKQDQADRQNQLAQLVQKMFTDQAGVSKLADLFSPENLKDVSPEDIAKAKEDVAEDGYWGVKQTSQRLFDFALPETILTR